MKETSRRGLVTWEPATKIRPRAGASSPAMSRSNVDLPQPDRPITATNSCSSTSRSIPSNTCTLSNVCATC
nr:hypothetical protein [Lentzea indica]